MVVQTVSFMYLAPYMAKRSLVRTAVVGLALRSACYAALGLCVYFISGIWIYRSDSHFLPDCWRDCFRGILYRIKYDGFQLPWIKGRWLHTGSIQRARRRSYHGGLSSVGIYLGILWIPCHISPCRTLPSNLGCSHFKTIRFQETSGRSPDGKTLE